MTTEEKAKAYDEALEKAKFYHGNCPSEPERKKLEKMFPVLRESEDERIISSIIAVLENDKKHYLEEIAWLEKQKELTPADGWDYADRRMSHPLYLEGFEAGRAVEREVSEPSAEWSEEDEKMLTGIIARGSSQVPPYDPALREEQIEWLMNRLKSLRPRSSWKPSEEQMEALLWCVAHLGGADRRVLAELYEHLKKL